MKWQIQTHSGRRRSGWQDAEVFEGSEAQAITLIERRSATDGQAWRAHEWVDHQEIPAERIAKLNAGGQ